MSNDGSNAHEPTDAPSPGASQTVDGIENDYYTQQYHGPYDEFSLGAFELEKGSTLRDCTIAYTTFGELNDAKDNAVLFPHMYSGTSKDMEIYVGDGLALDPSSTSSSSRTRSATGSRRRHTTGRHRSDRSSSPGDSYHERHLAGAPLASWAARDSTPRRSPRGRQLHSPQSPRTAASHGQPHARRQPADSRYFDINN